MLAKSIIAGTVLSLMAGGVVYFGTDLDTAVMKDNVAAKTTAIKNDVSDKVISSNKESSVETPSVKTASGKVIKAKNPTVSYTSKSDEKKPPAKTADAPKKKWLDQYLKSDKTENKEPSNSDTGTFIVEEETALLTEDSVETAEAEGFKKRALETENVWVEAKTDETSEKTTTRKMLRDILKKDKAIFIGEDTLGQGTEGQTTEVEKNIEVKIIGNETGDTTIETETIDMGDGKVMKIVKKTVKSEDGHSKDGKKMRIKVMTREEGHDELISEDIKVITLDKHMSIDTLINEAKDDDISETVEIVMAEIQKINQPDLRDRGYLSLICYGLNNGDYEVANTALENITHAGHRDTGRTRIAVAYAKVGQADEALALLKDIEVEASRDTLRLQVIEALIAPKSPH